MNISSPQALILDALKNRLAELKEFRLIDEYHSQSTYDTPRLAYPAVLIDIEDCQYDDAGERNQFVTAELSVRIIQANYSQSSQNAPEKSKERALSVYELEALVVGHLHGWSPTIDEHQITAPFARTTSIKGDTDAIGLRLRELRFATAWEETFPERARAYPAISVNGRIIV